MSTLQSTVGAMVAISLPTPLSPPAPMLVDGATPERVQGGQYPVPSTHRGDIYPTMPTGRPGPSSAPTGAAILAGSLPKPSTSWNRQGLARTSTDIAIADPFLRASAEYNMQQGQAQGSIGWTDYNLP